MIVMLRSGWSYVHNTCKTWSLNPATIHISGRPFWIDSLQLTFQPVWRRNSWREQCWGGQAQPRNLIGKLGQGEPITWSRQTKDPLQELGCLPQWLPSPLSLGCQVPVEVDYLLTQIDNPPNPLIILFTSQSREVNNWRVLTLFNGSLVISTHLKNTIRDVGNTALKTDYTVYTVYTI